MPVTTRRQLRSASHRNAISEGGPTEDALPRTMQESDNDDDLMGGSFAVSSSEDGEEHGSMWDEPVSGASEDESDREEGEYPELDDDYEGTFNTIRVYTPCKLRTQYRPPRQNASS